MSVKEKIAEEAAQLEREWEADRWQGIQRDYSAEDVVRLRGSVRVEHSLARNGAEKLWELLHGDEHVAALGAYSGAQAVQMVKAGLKAIYLSGWQVAGDANTRARRIPIRASIPPTRCPRSSSGSTPR